MAEYVNSKEETINVGDPIIFENKTEASFDVSLGIVFRKSGLYRVSVYGNNVSVQKEPERMRGKWLSHYDYCEKHAYNPSGSIAFWWCDQCEQAVEHPTNFCPNCGADMRGEEND